MSRGLHFTAQSVYTVNLNERCWCEPHTGGQLLSTKSKKADRKWSPPVLDMPQHSTSAACAAEACHHVGGSISYSLTGSIRLTGGEGRMGQGFCLHSTIYTQAHANICMCVFGPSVDCTILNINISV